MVEQALYKSRTRSNARGIDTGLQSISDNIDGNTENILAKSLEQLIRKITVLIVVIQLSMAQVSIRQN